MKYKTGFLAGAVLLAFLCGCTKTPSKEDKILSVKTETMTQHEFVNTLQTQGVVEAVDRAVLSALVPGRLVAVNFKEGDRVKKGDLLFRTEQENLKNACDLAEETLKAAQTRVVTRKNDLENAQIILRKAKIDFERSKQLFASKSVSSDTMEKMELAFNKAELAIDQAKNSLDTANTEVTLAETALKIARKKYSESEVYAPFDGVITAKLMNLNEFCGVGTPVLKMENPDNKRIVLQIGGLHYPEIQEGKTMIQVSTRGKIHHEVPVTIVGKAIDPASRTFELKADLPQETALPSGMLCDVTLILEKHTAPALPDDAILFRGKNEFSVYADDNGKAHEIPVKAGLSENGFTEILNPADLQGKKILTTGQYFVREGSQIVAE